MREVVLEYNPVTRACRTTLAGTPIAHLDQKYGDKGRIQGWIGAYLSELPELINEDVFGLCFKGTVADFEDVRTEVERVSGNGSGFTIEVAQLDGNPAELDLDGVHSTFASVLERVRGHEVFADAASFIESVEQLLHRNQFRVAVIATMSSGKSTLLNALIGRDLLPAGTQATTAILTYVHDVDGKPDASARCFNADGELLATHDLADRLTLKRINDPLKRESELAVDDDERVVRIDLELDVPAIDSPAAGQLVLIDTPGPNAAGNPQHHEVTYRLLEPGLEEDLDSEGADAVLYLMDYTKMAVNDDRDLLRDVAAMIRKGGIAAHDRFIFVVNRVNEHDCETDGDLSDGMGAAVDFLTEFADIVNPVLIPVDALGALYSRRLLQGEELTGRARRRYVDHAEILLDELDVNAVARCSPAVAARVHAQGDGAATEHEQVLVRSGVTMLEEYLRHYREKYWLPLKLQRVHARLDRRLLVEERVKRMEEEVASRTTELGEVRVQLKKLRDIASDSGLSEELTEAYERTRREAEATELPCLVDFQKKIDGLDISLPDETTPHAAAGALSDLQKDVGALSGRLNAQLETELKAIAAAATRELQDGYLKRLEKLLQQAGLDLPLPDVNLLDQRPLKLSGLVSKHKYKKPEARIRKKKVKRTGGKWNPLSWLFGVEKEIPETHWIKVERVHSDRLRAATRERLQRVVRDALGRARTARARVLDNIHGSVNAFAQRVQERLEQIAQKLDDQLVEERLREARLADARRARDELLELRAELDAAAKGPFSC